MVLHRTAELRTLLERLEPADALEEAHRARVLALLAEASDPFEREHYTPGHVTASAFVLDPARERVLLILHGKLGRWLQPGGHVDASDASVALAACREVLEETGLDVSYNRPKAGGAPAIELLDVDVHEIPARGALPAHEHFDVRFAFEATHTDARAGSDAKQARWVSIAELLSGGPHLPTDESVMRAVRKLSRRLS
jgi:8-oxo-dGTP pyrophosphatase MutT (NUDIX family)